MKKLLTIILAGIMAVSLAACSGGDKGTESSAENENNTTAQTTDVTETRGNPLAQYIISETADTTIIDLRNADIYEGMKIFENDEYSLSFVKAPEYMKGGNRSGILISINIALTNKTDDVIYKSNKPVNPGETVAFSYGLYPEDQQAEGEVLIRESPVDKDGNKLRQVGIYASIGATNKNIGAVILDNEFVTLTYNTTDENGWIKLSLTAKDGTSLKDSLLKDIIPGDAKDISGQFEDKDNGIAIVRVSFHDMNDKKVIEKNANGDVYGYMLYRYEITFNIKDGAVINIDSSSVYA